MDAVVLAGDGKWKKRFKLHVVGKRVIDYPLKALVNKGFNVYVVTRELDFDVPIITQKSNGVVGAIRDAIEELGLPILVVYGDVIADEDFYISPLRKSSSCAISVVPSVPEERHNTLIEMKFVDGKASTYVFGGALLLDNPCIDEIISTNNLIDALNKLVKKRLMEVVFYEGFWADIDNERDLLKAYKHLIEKKSPGIEIREGAIVHPTAQLMGKVIIDKKAYVGPFTIIKGPSYISEGSRVLGFNYIEASSLERRSTIEPFTYLRNVSIQPGVKINSFTKAEERIIEKNL